MEKSGSNKGINSTQLKWIAVITMLIDHIGLIFRQDIYAVLQSIFHVSQPGLFYLFGSFFFLGRIAFPLFAFQTAEGIRYTRSPERYLGRLFLFGVISELPFQWMIKNFTLVKPNLFFANVMFTLFLAVLACYCYRRLLLKGLPQFLCFIPMVVLAMLAEWLNTDYGAMGVMLIFALYMAYNTRQKLLIIGLWAFLMYGISLLDPKLYKPYYFNWMYVMAPVLYVLYTWLSLPVILFYNGQKGRGRQYIFYFFYPVHLCILAGIYYITH